MAADELTALRRAAGVVGDLDPATAWDLDGQLYGLAQVTLTLAEGMGGWSERLHGIGLHETVTKPIETGVTGLGAIAAGLTQSRRALRTAYAGLFAQAEANVRTIDKPAFWGETAASRGRHHVPAPADEPATLSTKWPAPVPPQAEQPATPGPGRTAGRYNPDQPRAADGKWIKVGDVLGYADGESCFGTDRVTGAGPVPTDLALIEYPPELGSQVSAFVSVATPKAGYNPATGKEENGNIYCAPQLGPAEAEAMADKLEELAEMVESGFRPPEPTRHTRARQRIELLLQEDRAAGRDGVAVGEDEQFPLTTAELLKLLVEADPTLSAAQTRHAVRAHASVVAGGEDGTVWLDIEQDAVTKAMQIVVTAVEGTESPDDDYNRQYAARHTPESARELAGKLRAFAHAARRGVDR
jgi:hypothetical protein